MVNKSAAEYGRGTTIFLYLDGPSGRSTLLLHPAVPAYETVTVGGLRNRHEGRADLDSIIGWFSDAGLDETNEQHQFILNELQSLVSRCHAGLIQQGGLARYATPSLGSRSNGWSGGSSDRFTPRILPGGASSSLSSSPHAAYPVIAMVVWGLVWYVGARRIWRRA
jgi:hypothetical protein